MHLHAYEQRIPATKHSQYIFMHWIFLQEHALVSGDLLAPVMDLLESMLSLSDGVNIRAINF